MILITGASGNNGSEIIRILSQQGVRIRAMTRRQHDPTRSSESGVEVVTGDFDDADCLKVLQLTRDQLKMCSFNHG
jgi:uncharacterized protein YbjT (DUF2867 family)